MNEITRKKYYTFLNNNKKLVGLSDWKIILKEDLLTSSTEYAEVEADFYEKEMTIQLSTDFEDLPVPKKKNVLLHELVHGRIDLFNKRRDQLVEELEEELVNDLTRGFERHGMLKW